jgi:hypothetical protein
MLRGTRGARTGRSSASSGRRSRLGSAAARPGPRRPPRRRRRAGTFSARVAISCAGVTSRMSHSAASTGSDSRSGTWVTSRRTCTDDRVMPRSASSGSRSDALKPGGGHHLPQPPPVAGLPPRHPCRARPGSPRAACAAPPSRSTGHARTATAPPTPQRTASAAGPPPPTGPAPSGWPLVAAAEPHGPVRGPPRLPPPSLAQNRSRPLATAATLTARRLRQPLKHGSGRPSGRSRQGLTSLTCAR